MSLYEPVDTWVMPMTYLRDSIAEMAPDGMNGNEGITLWAGTLESGVARLSLLIGLHGPDIEKNPLYIKISCDLFNRVSALCRTRGLTLLGQIHSHPKTFTDLSDVDRRYGIGVPYFLSVVAPHYAQRADTGWDDCGVHIFESKKGFRRMTVSEARTKIKMEATLEAPLERIS